MQNFEDFKRAVGLDVSAALVTCAAQRAKDNPLRVTVALHEALASASGDEALPEDGNLTKHWAKRVAENTSNAALARAYLFNAHGQART